MQRRRRGHDVNRSRRIVNALAAAAVMAAGSAVAIVAQAAPAMQVRSIGQGDPVALVGGGVLGADGWGALPARLAETRRVLLLQNLAVQAGLDDKPLPAGYSIRMESQAMARALDAAGVQMADIIGSSHGGAIALDFALNTPARVRTLTLVEPTAFWMLPNHGKDSAGAAEMQRLIGSYKDRPVTEVDLEKFRCALGECVGGASPRTSPDWAAAVAHRNALRGLYAFAEHDDNPSRLTALEMPVMLVAGTDTVAFHREINDAIGKLVPKSTILELLGGHNAAVQNAGQFAAAWTAFIKNAEANKRR